MSRYKLIKKVERHNTMTQNYLRIYISIYVLLSLSKSSIRSTFLFLSLFTSLFLCPVSFRCQMIQVKLEHQTRQDVSLKVGWKDIFSVYVLWLEVELHLKSPCDLRGYWPLCHLQMVNDLSLLWIFIVEENFTILI